MTVKRSGAGRSASARRFYVIGYFGEPNFGDELLCWVELRRLRQYFKGECSFLSVNGERSRQYTDPDGYAIEGFFPSLAYYIHLGAHIRAIYQSDLLVIGGGGLLGDHYAWTAVPRYAIDALWATVLGRRFVLVGLGVRDIKRRWIRHLSRWLLANAVRIYCRDGASAERATYILPGANVRVGPDLAHLVRLERRTERSRRYTILNLRKDPPLDRGRVVELALIMQERFGYVVLLAAERVDLGFYRELVRLIPAQYQESFEICWPRTLEEAIDVISLAGLVVAERLHVNLVAVHAGVPVVAVAYEDKVREVLREITAPGATRVVTLEDVGPRIIDGVGARQGGEIDLRVAEERRRAAERFDEAVRGGLSCGRPALSRRFTAILWLCALLPMGTIVPGLSRVRKWRRRVKRKAERGVSTEGKGAGEARFGG